MFEQMLENCFPNSGDTSGPCWATIVPPDDTIDVTSPIDLGRIPNQSNKPEDGKWRKEAKTVTFDKNRTETWYRLVGDQGKRYSFSTKEANRKEFDLPVTVTFHQSVNNKPSKKAIQTLEHKDGKPITISLLNHGFYFDTPDGKATDQTYFLCIKKTDSTATEQPTLTLRAFETTANPAPGSFHNPIWEADPSQNLKGCWTMALDAAAKQAADANKPLLLHFTGMTWCPYCIKIAHTIMDSETEEGKHFKALIGDTYPVILDNQFRDETIGPSLMLNWQKKGYMAQNGITDDAASDKLALNKELEKQLSIPHPDFVNQIGYPTFVLCHVNTTEKPYTLEPIGRFEPDSLTVEQADNSLTNLVNLYNEHPDYREKIQFHQTSNAVIASAPATAILGDTIRDNWFKIPKLSQASTWIFTATLSAELTDGQELSMNVYDSQGHNRLSEASLHTGTETTFEVKFNAEQGTNYWLKVSQKNLTKLLEVTIKSQQKHYVATLKLPKPTIYVGTDAKTVTLPLTFDFYQNEQGISFQYKLEDQNPNNPLNQPWQTFTWKPGAPKSLTITLPDLKLDEATQNQFFTIRFKETDPATCAVSSNLEATIGIMSASAFYPFPSEVDLFVGQNVNLDIPVFQAHDKDEIMLRGSLPEGLTLDVSKISTESAVFITGTPKKSTTSPTPLILLLWKNGIMMEPYKLEVTLKVHSADSLPVIKIDKFTGILKDADGLETGMVLIAKESPKTLKATMVTKNNKECLTAAISDWTLKTDSQGYSSVTGIWNLSEDQRLTVSLDKAGKGKATFQDLKGITHYADVVPVITGQKDFTDKYTVGLRKFDDSEGLTEGWITMQIDDANGIQANLILCDAEPAQPLPVNTCLTMYEDEDGYGKCMLYVPYKWNNTDKYYERFFFGTLKITPKSKRTEEQKRNYVSACEPWAQINGNGKAQELSACGTAFNPTDKLMDLVKEKPEDTNASCVFISQLDTKTILPNYIILTERTSSTTTSSTQKTFTFSPNSDQGIMAKKMNSVTVQPDGQFTLKTDAFLWNKDMAQYVPQAIEINGIIIPTRTFCCSPSLNVAMGYGYFTAHDKLYKIRLAYDKESLKHLAPPEVVDLRRTKTPPRLRATFKATDNIVLCQVDSGESNPEEYVFNADGGLLPADFKTCDVYALPIESKKTESQPIRLENAQNDDAFKPLLTLTTKQSGDTEGTPSKPSLHEGWNLIAVSSKLTVPGNTLWTDEAGKSYPCFGYDTKALSMYRAEGLVAGQAYWLYIPRGKDLTLTLHALKNVSETPATTVTGWSLSEIPSNTDNLIIWLYKDGRFQQLKSPKDVKQTDGAWLYKDK